MRQLCMTLLAGACLLSIAASASASRGVGYAPGGAYSSRGTLSFRSSFVTGSCALATSGTYGLTPKIRDAAASRTATAMTAAACTANAIITFLNIGLWRWHYQSFTGTLPNVTGLNYILRDVEILYQVGIFRCLYKGPVVLTFTFPNQDSWFGVLPLFPSALNTPGGCPATFDVTSTIGTANQRPVLLDR